MAQEKRPRRMPKETRLDTYDEDFEKLLVQAVEALVRATNPRRARRVAGLLADFRDASASGNQTLYEYYRRVAMETFMEAINSR